MPSNDSAERPLTVVSEGLLPAVAWLTSLALLDLSFQQPAVVVAAVPLQDVPANRVAASAPSSHSFSADDVITLPAGYVVSDTPDDAGPAPMALFAVTVTE